MDDFERYAAKLEPEAEKYEAFLEGNSSTWSPYIQTVVRIAENSIRRLESAYARGEFYDGLGNDEPRYKLKIVKVKSEAWKQIELGLETDPTISGKVVEIIRRPSSQGYPLGDPRNNDSIVIKCDKPNTVLTLMIPLLPEWESAEPGNYVDFFSVGRYYRATLRKGGGLDEG